MNDLKDYIHLIIFDWGDTLMRDYPELPGPMYTWKHVECVEGAPELLDNLHKRYVLCVATNAGASDTVAMRKALQRVNIEQYFSGFFSSKDLGVAKPDPMFFLKICNSMSIEPKYAMMVGNDYAKDICGAARAGLHTIYFVENIEPKGFVQENFPLANHIVHHLLDLMQIL